MCSTINAITFGAPHPYTAELIESRIGRVDGSRVEVEHHFALSRNKVRKQCRLESTRTADYAPSPGRTARGDEVVYAGRDYDEIRDARGTVRVQHHRPRHRQFRDD